MKHLGIVLDDETHEKFRRYARSLRRTMKDQITWMIEEAVKKYEKGLAESDEQ